MHLSYCAVGIHLISPKSLLAGIPEVVRVTLSESRTCSVTCANGRIDTPLLPEGSDLVIPLTPYLNSSGLLRLEFSCKKTDDPSPATDSLDIPLRMASLPATVCLILFSGAVIPYGGPLAGGNIITLIGQFLIDEDKTTAPVIMLADVAAEVVSSSSTMLVVKARPAESAHVGDIVIDEGWLTLYNSYQYFTRTCADATGPAAVNSR